MNNWEKEFNTLFVYTDFADENGLPVNRPWRPTFGLPDREIASLKLFVESKLQIQKSLLLNKFDGLFLEKAKMQWKNGELDKWEIQKKDFNEIIYKMRDEDEI